MSCDFWYMCCLFKFRGIECRRACHSHTKKVKTVPLKYVLERWREKVRSGHTYVAVQADDLQTTLQTVRFDRISKIFNEIVDMQVESNDRCHVVMAGLRERIEKSVCDSKEPTDSFQAKPSDDDYRVLSSVAVRVKGRQPFKRKVSGIDVAVKRKKEYVRKRVNMYAF